ncbi:cupin domain-containing protein [Nonomuraea sp. KC401]|uniref:cupin domain-containing protein n=1 Tax=unclassified Nonomuraea TaxID=2593643 RepID=UPI0010FE7792|nr:cupin domain-containing protein [Nonomuraea sp. KC401]NBE99613.1 cupin domain-containing protein [Nonomuraea sp. K271]TLF56419.1 cupin domain-containing protein [Nonomuraea sp. KC401]
MDHSSQPDGHCRVIRSAVMYEGKQHLQFFAGIAAETVGARNICMHLQTIPPAGGGRAHKHDHHETAIYVIKGAVGAWYGQDLQHYLEARQGEFIYIPASTPHMPVNLSDREPAEVVLARTDPREQESTVLLPDLERQRLAPASPPPAD